MLRRSQHQDHLAETHIPMLVSLCKLAMSRGAGSIDTPYQNPERYSHLSGASAPLRDMNGSHMPHPQGQHLVGRGGGARVPPSGMWLFSTASAYVPNSVTSPQTSDCERAWSHFYHRRRMHGKEPLKERTCRIFSQTCCMSARNQS